VVCFFFIAQRFNRLTAEQEAAQKAAAPPQAS
jgi:hypothetical protein